MDALAKILLALGLTLSFVGLAIWLGQRYSGPVLFKLPGDIRWKFGHGQVFVPIASMLIISGLLSLVLNLVGRLRR